MTGSEINHTLSRLSVSGQRDNTLRMQQKNDPEKSEIHKDIVSQDKGERGSFLTDWWDWVLNRTGLAEKVKSDASGAVLPWIEMHIDMSRLVLDEKSRRQLHEVSDTPLQGAAGDLPERAGGLAEESFSYSPDAWRNFLRGRVAATLRRFKEEDVKPETRIDLLLQVIKPARGKLGARFLRSVLPVAYKELQMQMADDRQRRESGFYKTWGALADHLTKESDTRLLRWACFLYAGLLAELEELRHIKRGARVERAWLDILEADANNLASVLDDLGEYAHTQWLLRVSAAAALAGLRKRRTAPVDESALASAIAPLLAAVPGVAPQKKHLANVAEAVAHLFNISRCWLPHGKEGAALPGSTSREAPNKGLRRRIAALRGARTHADLPEMARKPRPQSAARQAQHPSRSFLQRFPRSTAKPQASHAPDEILLAPCLGVLSATLAAVAAQDTDGKAVVALFNTGNLLNRIETGGYVQQTAIARAILNAAGMYWALKDADNFNELVAAANKKHGIDCAVNFLGALADFDDFPAEVQAPLDEFASAVWMLHPFGDNEKDFRRMKISLELLGGTEPDPDFEVIKIPARLCERLGVLVASLAAGNCRACLESWHAFTGAPTAETLSSLLASVLGSNFHIEYPPSMQRALHEIQAVIDLSERPANLLDDLPEPLKVLSMPVGGDDTGTALADVLAANVSAIARISRGQA